MQVVIEDYVLGEGLKVVLLAANTLFSVAVAVIGILAVLKLALGA
jgi:succinate dehydrogenase / fumarate reductase membrane anchor subunit